MNRWNGWYSLVLTSRFDNVDLNSSTQIQLFLFLYELCVCFLKKSIIEISISK